MNISKNVFYVGVNDKQIDLFEGLYDVPNGMAYNSYVIMDDKIVVMDAVDERFADEWLANVAKVLDGRTPDYLVVQHMEPDHSGSVMNFVNSYPSAKIVASARAFIMMKNFFGTDFADKRVQVKEGSELCLGEHTLTFVEAPMATKKMKDMLSNCKNLTYTNATVKILSALSSESENQLALLADELGQ